MTKILAAGSALIITVLLFLGVLPVQNKSKIEELERSPERGTLSWHAQMAKAKGKQSVNLRASLVDYAVPRSFDDALANYSLVVAEPIESRSFASTFDIRTWYKFRLVEVLSTPPASCVDCEIPTLSPPQDLLPLGPNEFLSAQAGGDATVDGIKITSSDPTFPKLKTGKPYLLLVAFDSQKVIGALRSGPGGAFEISGESLAPVTTELKYPLRQKFSEQFQNSLSNLRLFLKTRN